MVPTKPATYAVFVEFSQVKQKIIDVENSIQATEATIQGVESRLNAAERLDDSDPKKAGEVQYLRAKEIKLRAEKAELRSEKAKLSTEAVLLRVKVEPQFEKNSKKSFAQLATDLLPPPIDFKEQMVGDTNMMVAVTSAKSTVWLELDSFKKVADFLNQADIDVRISDRLSAPAAPLVLVGPVKCSKSAMIDIIDGILSQHYHLNIAAGRSPRLPVALKWNISPFDDPSRALMSLRGSIELLALELGIEVPSGMTFKSLDQSIDSTKTMFCQFVKQAAERNICVWLYVDEIQAPVLHAFDSLERMLFVYFIKNLVDQARLHSRVVLTGSSMHSFLHQVRSLAVNGFSLWNNSNFVILGRPLSDSCVKAIGETIFSYHLQERKKQSLVGNTFDELLEQIKLNDQFSLSMTARPAVLNEIIATIPDSGDFAAGAKHAIDLLANKIQKETTTDIGKLFSEIRSDVRTLNFFRQVACGKSDSSGDMSVDRFISVLCGRDPDSLTSNSSQRQLLIPYSAIFQNFLTETGEFTVAMEDISQTA